MNAGAAFFERNMGLLADGDLDGYIATFAPDYTIEDRQPGAQVTLSGAEAATNARAFFELFVPLERVDYAVLDVRSTYVCAHRVAFEAAETAFVAELTVVDRYDRDGLLQHSVFLGPTASIDAALDQLASETPS